MNESLQELKRRLCEPPVLAYPDMAKLFLVYTDAFLKDFAAVFSQLDNNGREHPFMYASRLFTAS